MCNYLKAVNTEKEEFQVILKKRQKISLPGPDFLNEKSHLKMAPASFRKWWVKTARTPPPRASLSATGGWKHPGRGHYMGLLEEWETQISLLNCSRESAPRTAQLLDTDMTGRSLASCSTLK